MKNAPAWIGVILGLINSGVLGWNGWQGRKRRKAIGPADDVRTAVERARDGFQTLLEQGGATDEWFLTDPRPLRDQPLEDLARRAADTTLSELLKNIAASSRRCFASAAPRPGPRVYAVGVEQPAVYREEDARIASANLAVVEAARLGQAQCEMALDRLNHLERRL